MQKLETAPAFKSSILFAIGIFTCKYFNLPYYLIITLISSLMLFYFLLNRKYYYFKFAVTALLLVSAGMLKSNFDFNNQAKNSVAYLKNNVNGVFLSGVINNLPEYSKDRMRFVIEANSVISEKDTLNISGKILVILQQTKETDGKDSLPDLDAGDEVIMYGDLKDAPDEKNPGDFNYKNYLALNDINKVFKVYFFDDLILKSRKNLNLFEQYIIYPARKYAIRNIKDNVGGDEASFLNGLVTGYRADFSKELKDDFVKAGVMHLIAVSGLNVAYIIIFLTILFSLLRVPLNLKIYLMIVSLVFYCFFAGASASILRAVIMGSLLLLNFKVQRKINFLNVIGLSAFIILLIDSRQLFDAGFILSYSAVISIVVIFERINEIFGNKIESWTKDYRKIFYYAYIILLTSLSAQAGVLPITIKYFEKVSVVGIVTNVIAIPLSNFSLALGFIQVLCGIMSPFLSSVVAEVNFVLLHFQLMFIKWAAGLSFSYFEVFGINIFMLLLYYLVLGLLMSCNKRNITFRLTLSSLLIIMYFVFSSFNSKELRVTFLSIGNADCTHIESPDGSNILVEIGIENQYNHSTSSRIVPYLKRKGVEEIDLLIVNNGIGKNYKALSVVLQNFNVKKIIVRDVNDLKGNIEELIIRKKIIVERFNDIKEICGFGNLKFYFLKNYSGCAVKLLYGKNSFLFPGKADEDEESELMKIYNEGLKSDVLKIAGYGSDKSTSIEFLMKVKPGISVISTAGIKEKDLPSPYLLRRLNTMNSNIFRTDDAGAVVLLSDGNKLRNE